MTQRKHETIVVPAQSGSTVARPNPRMKVAYFTAKQHAIGAAYVHRMHNTVEEMLDRLETEHEDEVYRRVCQRFGFDPTDQESLDRLVNEDATP